MSSREPLWFCHQCNAEMRPLMMPHPVCASCRSDFVEKMEDPADDPREFSHGHEDIGAGDVPPGIDTFLYQAAHLPTVSLQQLLDRGIAEGGPSVPRTAPRNENPIFTRFLRGPTHAHAGGTITGPLMAQYLMALLGRPGEDFFGRGMGDAASQGRMGDYVFNQEGMPSYRSRTNILRLQIPLQVVHLRKANPENKPDPQGKKATAPTLSGSYRLSLEGLLEADGILPQALLGTPVPTLTHRRARGVKEMDIYRAAGTTISTDYTDCLLYSYAHL
ncbi:hypothetical protein DXG01_009716 [Tephrocybe rancida]|nr:hypothetical protein DXG01_009716 [Tephrocybe rancida]